MARASIILIDGKPYRWSDLTRLRKEQLAASRRDRQPALFADLPHDRRPAYERTASERHRQPSLFTLEKY
jgi:hypothetical protein